MGAELDTLQNVTAEFHMVDPKARDGCTLRTSHVCAYIDDGLNAHGTCVCKMC